MEAMEINYKITRLDKTHNRKNFDCGVEALNRYIREFVSQDEKRNLAKCYVLLDEENIVLGFYTLASSGIPIDALPEEIKSRLPRYFSVPTISIGRLATSVSHQKMRLGETLLFDALKRMKNSEAGIYAFAVDAKDENAAAFYQKYGFIALPDNPLSLYLPIANLSL